MMVFKDDYKHKGLRKRLVKTIQSKGIKDENVLEAISKVPRHIYFDNALLHHAYEDKAFPIGYDQTISQPYTVARQTELLEVKKGDKVLEIGTGSGYQACVLAEMGVDLYTIESVSGLYERSKKIISRLGYKVNCFLGDGTLGLTKKAPFDGIIVTAGAPKVPESLKKQLKIGGRLIIPVGQHQTQTMLRVVRETEDKFREEDHGMFVFVPLKGKEGW
ncbi:protein-L-isoaspartate(D-aspartate) O-methyltransferase [Hyphobacterium sp. CCMP332]|nr:protein-L-isoaspartate(D-aspartate) O-methyltransferase [Hyphobacterium sp. CCMP332]